jgi:hypothetical protein
MKSTSYPALDGRRSWSRMALVPLWLSLCLLLGSCGSVETTDSTQDADPLSAVALDMKATSEASSAAQPANAELVDSRAVKPPAKPTQSTQGTKVQSTLSDEQAAEIAIRLAQGTAAQADKRALHAYLENSR